MTLLLVVFIGGVLSILSPCILPVIPFVFARGDQPSCAAAAADREVLLDGRLLEILTQTRGYRRRRASVRCRRSHRCRRALRARRRSAAGVEIGGAGVRVSIVTAKNSRKRRAPLSPAAATSAGRHGPTVRRRRSPRGGIRLAPGPSSRHREVNANSFGFRPSHFAERDCHVRAKALGRSRAVPP